MHFFKLMLDAFLLSIYMYLQETGSSIVGDGTQTSLVKDYDLIDLDSVKQTLGNHRQQLQ